MALAYPEQVATVNIPLDMGTWWMYTHADFFANFSVTANCACLLSGFVSSTAGRS